MNIFFIFLNIIIFSLKIIAGELPTGENVVAGSASITQDSMSMNINQSTNNAIIEWQSFDNLHSSTSEI